MHTLYTSRLKQRTRAIRPTNRCFIRACPARRIEENRPGVPRATCSNLLHSRCNPVCYIYVYVRGDQSLRLPRRWESTRVFDRLLDFEHLLSCPPRVRGATYARIRPYTCNYFGQSVLVKSYAGRIYPRWRRAPATRGLKARFHGSPRGIRCRFTILPNTVRSPRFHTFQASLVFWRFLHTYRLYCLFHFASNFEFSFRITLKPVID